MLNEAIDILERLVAFPTVSADSNLELIGHAEQRLAALGARVRITRSADGSKANLFATMGPEVDGGVVLSGHTDVVPVAGQDWHSDPFSMHRQDDRLYGRGACDMKGFVACALAMAARYARMDLRRPVHFALTFDEEVGCLGAPLLLADLADCGLRPAVAIIGEPTEMRIIEGHKGCYEYTTEITGLEGHGSAPDKAVNAVEYAVRYIGELLATGEALKARAPAGSPFDPPHTTVSVGSISGGIARNIVAKACRFEWEMRPVQHADAEYALARMARYAEQVLLPEMRARYEQASISTATIAAVDGLEPMAGSAALQLAAVLTGGNARDVVSFGTEAGLFQAAGISTVVCGPGSIDQAHKPNEFVAVAQLEACLAMLERLGKRLSSPQAGPAPLSGRRGASAPE